MKNTPLPAESLSPTPTRPPLSDKIVRRIGGWLLLLFVIGICLPIRSGSLRFGLVAGGILVWTVTLYLLRRSRIGLALLVAPTVLALGAFLAPGRPIDHMALREQYVANLRSLTGIPYIWGAETRVALDCSGLVRYALIETNFREGIRTANPALLRTAASLWWNDASAQALGENYHGLTVPVSKAHNLNEADYAPLHPGDLAITAGGKHILAYLGDKTWIQADPVPMRVVQSPVPNTSGWFMHSAWFVRWRELE